MPKTEPTRTDPALLRGLIACFGVGVVSVVILFTVVLCSTPGSFGGPTQEERAIMLYVLGGAFVFCNIGIAVCCKDLDAQEKKAADQPNKQEDETDADRR